MTELTHVSYTLDSRGVITITLERPEKHNAFDDIMISELRQCFDRASNEPTARALILASKGKSFCAGADLGWMQRMASYTYEQNKADAGELAAMFDALYRVPVPTIARVQGAAFGGAVGLIACCDIAIANKLSKFCLSEVKIGLIPATISPYVIEAMGARVAKRYFMTAEVFSSRRARRLGLVSECVTDEELDSTIEDIISNLLANGPDAVKLAKTLAADVAGKPIDSALMTMTSELIAKVRVSDEGQEGLNAFLQKRTPAWREDNA
ncbi:enoyl-CoA hydratase/isomerase family protein [Alteromonas facilis]|uniref:enoyl-CoA hydratase/isomerase family protein n=1 Tax=Alteromonas facilis TaxID=2048004 RepID=UPI000C28D390|nr:enoyl-CoA hydratase/isomerase family protein [Alteromonas facilis]